MRIGLANFFSCFAAIFRDGVAARSVLRPAEPSEALHTTAPGMAAGRRETDPSTFSGRLKRRSIFFRRVQKRKNGGVTDYKGAAYENRSMHRADMKLTHRTEKRLNRPRPWKKRGAYLNRSGTTLTAEQKKIIRSYVNERKRNGFLKIPQTEPNGREIRTACFSLKMS